MHTNYFFKFKMILSPFILRYMRMYLAMTIVLSYKMICHVCINGPSNNSLHLIIRSVRLLTIAISIPLLTFYYM